MPAVRCDFVHVAAVPSTQNTLTTPQNLKLKAIFTLPRRKGRLVIRGFTLRYGIHYFETFAPTVRPESIRMLYSTAASLGSSYSRRTSRPLS